MGDVDTTELMNQISDRLDAIGAQVSEETVRGIIQNYFSELSDDDPVVRKMRFGNPKESNDPLYGSKYSRWGLDVSDVEFMYDLLNAAKDAGRSRGPSEALTVAFTAISDAVYMTEDEVRAMDKRALDDLFPRIPKQWLRGTSREEAYERALRAMDSAESGFGSQLIGAQYVRELWTSARPESRVASLIDQFEMTDPTVYLPVEVDIPEMLFVGENTANNSSEYTTVKTGSQRVQVDAKKFVIHQMWSGELEEDSIIPFIPYLRAQAEKAVAYYTDSLVLNGDTTNAATGNINLDDADPADTKHYLAFDGIRHAALVDNTANASDAAGAVTLSLLSGLRGLMLDNTRLNDWGHPSNPQDLFYVADPGTADAIALLDEIITWRQNAGNAGALLDGEVGRVLGHPVISSNAMPRTEADGKVSTTAANNTKGQVALINRNGFKIGWRRRIRVEVDRRPGRDQTSIFYSMRMGFGRFTPTGNVNAIESAAVLYNIT